jgi:chromosome segregation protein
MRLSKIKLAGFKSFVDPAVLHLPGNLLGVVGPNGCGKSNIIDAVRWVMGESSARSLRGESMSDVIFNGSASRKPVGQASVELVFDNSQGRLGGPWASYGEIAIKRLVAAMASPATSSTARAAAAGISPTSSWAPDWGRAAMPLSNRA